MRQFVTTWLCLVGLLGCTEPVTSEAQITSEVSQNEAEDISFDIVLAQHQALNARLDAVTYKLRRENAGLCPQTTRSLGFTVHTVADYPANIRPLARSTLSVSEDVSIRTVWAGSPAHESGLRPGDKITRLGGYDLPTGATAKKLFEAISAQGLNAVNIDISILREGQALDYQLRPETLCGYEARILWVEQVNAFTNGETLLITSELLRQTPSDNDLAMFVAHEMAHAIAGHVDEAPSHALEIEADRMGLILMSRAGFDVGAAIENWANTVHPHFRQQDGTSSHPSVDQRLDNLRAVEKTIQDLEASGLPLNFD